MDLSCLARSVLRQACPGLAEDTLLPANGVKAPGNGESSGEGDAHPAVTEID